MMNLVSCQEDPMSAPPTDPHGTVAAVAVLVTIGATLCVTYWRMVLRVLLIAAIAVAVSGVVVVIYGLVWLVTRLHA
jgi:hypothetical protein